MPVWNGADYLADSLDSIRRQTLADYEFVIVDDGSSDGTWALLQAAAAADSRLRISRHDENRGLLEALNRGLEAACGEYVARQDADDISRPERLKRQLAFMQEHPGVSLLGSSYEMMDAGGNPLGTRRQPETDTEIRWRMLFDNAFSHTTVMLRRLLPDGSPVRYVSRYCEDYDLWTRLLRIGTGCNLPEHLVVRRDHEQTYTVYQASDQQARRAEISLREMRAVLPDLAWGTEEVNRLYEWYYNLPSILGTAELALCADLLRLLGAFARLPGCDPGVTRSLCRSWTKRVLDSTPDYRYVPAWRQGVVRQAFALSPSCVVRDFVGRLKRRVVRPPGPAGARVPSDEKGQQ